MLITQNLGNNTYDTCRLVYLYLVLYVLRQYKR